jgi:hypothetical protein
MSGQPNTGNNSKTKAQVEGDPKFKSNYCTKLLRRQKTAINIPKQDDEEGIRGTTSMQYILLWKY